MCSTLSLEDSQKFIQNISVRDHELSNVRKYINNIKNDMNGYLPKSKTCCLSLRKNVPEFFHIK